MGRRFTGVSNRIIPKNLERLVHAAAKLEVRCLVVPGCTDGEDIAARHAYLHSLGIGDSQIVDLEYHDYARSKYAALGMRDTMLPRELPNHEMLVIRVFQRFDSCQT